MLVVKFLKRTILTSAPIIKNKCYFPKCNFYWHMLKHFTAFLINDIESLSDVIV